MVKKKTQNLLQKCKLLEKSRNVTKKGKRKDLTAAILTLTPTRTVVRNIPTPTPTAKRDTPTARRNTPTLTLAMKEIEEKKTTGEMTDAASRDAFLLKTATASLNGAAKDKNATADLKNRR